MKIAIKRRKLYAWFSSFALLTFFWSCTIAFYEHLRLMLGVRGVCRFHVSCSTYARWQLQHEPSLLIAVYRIAKRLLACRPF